MSSPLNSNEDIDHSQGSPGEPESGAAGSSKVAATNRRSTPVARIAAVTVMVLATALVAGAGAVLGVRTPTAPAPVEVTGSTLRTCPVLPPESGRTEVMALSTSTWGTLQTRGLGTEESAPVEGGKGARIVAPAAPVLLQAEGRQTQSSAGASFARAEAGADRSISLARCDHPATASWFSGLMASNAQRSELTLTNPDSAQAEVDLTILGDRGPIAAPGARGLTVPGGTTRTIALETMVNSPDPFGVEVSTTRGRISAVARHRTFDGVSVSGADWQTSAAEPATDQVIAAIPSGAGERTLAVTNPGNRRTTVKVEALGAAGTFQPADAAQVEVNGESTTSVRLDQALDGEAVALRLTSDQPIFAAAQARGEGGARADVAVQSADRALAGTSVGAFAVDQGSTAEVVLSSVDDRDLTAEVHLVSAAGEKLKTVQLPVRSGSTTVWQVEDIDQPAGVLVSTPRRSGLHGGVVTRTDADGYRGLASSGLSVPEQARAGVDPQFDPTVG